MAWLHNGEKILKICSFILTEFMYMTDRQTDRHRMMAKAALAQDRAAKIITVITNTKIYTPS